MKFNKTLLKPYVDTLEDIKKEIFTQDMIAFEQERQALLSKYSEKNSHGDTSTSNTVAIKKELISEFNAKIEELHFKNREVSNSMTLTISQFEELLNENYDIKLHYILLEDVPDEITDFDSETSAAIFDLIH
jgi:predicted XRE-type DNA-binding protein